MWFATDRNVQRIYIYNIWLSKSFGLDIADLGLPYCITVPPGFTYDFVRWHHWCGIQGLWLYQLYGHQCCHIWCFERNVWRFGDKSDVDNWAVVFVFKLSVLLRWKEVRFIIIEFLSSISHPHASVEPLRCVDNTFCVTHDRLLHTTLCSVSETMTFTAALFFSQI